MYWAGSKRHIQTLLSIKIIAGHSDLCINRTKGQNEGCCREYWSWQHWTRTAGIHVAFVCVVIHNTTWAYLPKGHLSPATIRDRWQCWRLKGTMKGYQHRKCWFEEISCVLKNNSNTAERTADYIPRSAAGGIGHSLTKFIRQCDFQHCQKAQIMHRVDESWILHSPKHLFIASYQI